MGGDEASRSRDERCPCDTGRSLERCCGRLHAGTTAVRAVDLMRSRFSAFVVGDVDHLRRSWDRATVPATIDLDPDQRWESLEILDVDRGTMFDDVGRVHFVATFSVAGQRQRLEEISRFRRGEDGWVYVDAEMARVELA